MARLNPEEYLDQLKSTKTEAGKLKSSILAYSKTAARHVKSMGTVAATFKDTAGQERDSVVAIRKDAKNEYNRFSRTYNAAMNKRTGVEAKHNKVLKLADETSVHANTVSKLHTKANNEKAEISDILKSSRKNDKEIQAIHGEAERVNQEIKNTYGITLDTTMAGTLVERRDALKKRTQIWEIIYISSIGVIALSILVILLFSNETNFLEVLTKRLVFISPLVVIAIIVGRQYSHERKLYEEYAFKAAAAQSLRGYTLLLNSEFKDMEEARLDILDFVIGAMKDIYDREPLTQSPSHFSLMFGNRSTKFEAKLEEAVVKATKAAHDDNK